MVPFLILDVSSDKIVVQPLLDGPDVTEQSSSTSMILLQSFCVRLCGEQCFLLRALIKQLQCSPYEIRVTAFPSCHVKQSDGAQPKCVSG